MSGTLAPASGTTIEGSSDQLASVDPTTQVPSTPSSDYISQQSNAIIGAQLAASEEGSKSFLDSASDIITKGVPLTAAAVVNSFVNTAVEAGNFFGADLHKATIENEFGPDSDTTAYYQEHSGAIEGVALAAGSLIPGIGATKVLRLAQLGKFGNTMRITTGLFSGIRDTAVKAATEDLLGNATGTSLFGLSAVNKTKAILAGVGDQALQGAVYETATLATMHASPITDNNTLSDNISDVWDAAKGFAVVGGLIDGVSSFSKINKAIKKADVLTKPQEAFGSRGLGNLTPGDRILTNYSTLDAIPKEDLSRLGQMKLNITTNTTQREIREQLTKAAGGDEELAGAFHKFIEAGREDGSIGPEQLTNNLGQLSKIGRHGDTSITSQPNEVFYVPKSIDQTNISAATHDDLMHPIAVGESSTSKAYTLTSPTLLPTIGRASDTVGIPSVTITAPKYLGALDAYKQGVDIFVDSKGVTHINPGSQVFKEVPRPGESRKLSVEERKVYETTGNLPKDSQPLNAIGLTLDLSSGKIFGESPLPVVGDIGKPTLTAGGNGLKVGDNLFPQVPGVEFAPISPLDANSRYVWAAKRGIRNGDSIAANDLPMLEQAYREKVAGFDHPNLTTFTDGSAFPQDASSLLQHIADTKQEMYADLLGQGKNADEIGHILNAPTKGITLNFNSLKPEELMIPPEVSSNIRHVRLAYDIGTTKDSEGNLIRGMLATNYRVKLANDGNSDQVAGYLSKFFGTGDPTGKKATDLFKSLQLTQGAGDADIAGAGASFFTNANANFGTLANQTQRVGRAVGELLTQRNSVISDTLSRSRNALVSDPAAAAEYGNFVAVRHSTPENFVMLSDADALVNNLPKNTAVLEGAVTRDTKTGAVRIDQGYIPSGFVPGSDTTSQGLKTYYSLSDKVADLERASQSLNNVRNSSRADWWNAQGVSKGSYNPDILYAPPIDTNRYPFMAYVRNREGYALGESGAHVIIAKDAVGLQEKIARLGPEYDAFTKSDIANFKKAEGEYEFNRNFMNNKVVSEFARKGILNNVVPETRPQNLIDHLASWHYRQEAQLLRDHVELHNAATFEQLRSMGERFDQTGTSRFGAITPFMQRSATNPYQAYIRTALGLSKSDNYPIWQLAQEKLEAFAGTAFNMAREAFGAARKGILPYEEAAKVSEKFGLGNPYGTALSELAKKDNYYGGLANSLPDPKLFSKFVATANTILGAGIIRLDTFQQLIHAVTLPIMVALEHGSATKDLQELLSVKLPGPAGAVTQSVPGFTKTLFNAVKNFFGDTDGKLADWYTNAAGLTRDELQIYRQMINQLSMPLGKLSESGWAQKIEGATQSAEKLTGTKFTNRFIHFVASDSGRQIGEAQGLSGQELNDFIGTFTGRVIGNIAAGQRATVFSGPIGQAVGLFGSYQWNLMQQLLRHIGDGDVKALAMGAGMQSSIFGLSSLPGFHALNSLIAERHGNTEGRDLYSTTTSLLGKDAGDYLLYGSLSGLLGTSLYTRGDINPRRATLLPVNPLNFPSVSAGMRVYQTLAQLENNITTKGGSVSASLLLAAEHNGLSRPLTGLAELAQGFTTNSKGDLVSTNRGLSDLSNISTMSRILGARPLEEGVALDALYRQNALKVLDSARLNELGQAAKTAMYGNSYLAPAVTQQFMSDYVKAGGNQENFNSWFLQQSRNANVSAVNRSFENFHSPRSQTLQIQMGGVQLPDFRNTGVGPSSEDPGSVGSE